MCYVSSASQKTNGNPLPIADVAASEKKRISQNRHTGRQGKTRTFVENEQLATAHYRTRERQYLPLADGEVAPAARNLAVERETVILVVAL